MPGRTAHAHDAAVLTLESRAAAPQPARTRKPAARTRRPADALPADLGVALAHLQAAGLAPEVVDITDTTDSTGATPSDAARAS